MNLLQLSAYTATSALGHGRAAHWQALQSGQTGLVPMRAPLGGIERCELQCHIGPVTGLETPLAQPLRVYDCRNHRLAWLALQQDGFLEAVARLRERHGAGRIGVFIGTSTAGIAEAERAYAQRLQSGRDALPDWFDHRHTQNLHSPAAFVAAALQCAGPVLAVSTACSSSAKVFAAAWRALQLGYCDAAVVGGVDSLCLTTLYGFNSLQLVAPEPCRPGDVARRGISIGEGAAFAIVERPRDAAFVLRGYGESGDAHHMSAPDPQGRGACDAMRAALQRGAATASDVDYINLHGTGTPANDAAEDAGVFALFGALTPCSSTKGWTGHTLGAAGALEAVLSLLCLEHGFVPCSLNLRVPDPALRANMLLTSRRQPLRQVLSNSFGFGGSNCSLLFGWAP